MSQAKYKRVIIKISGEALSGAKGNGFDHDYIDKVVDQLLEARKQTFNYESTSKFKTKKKPISDWQ